MNTFKKYIYLLIFALLSCFIVVAVSAQDQTQPINENSINLVAPDDENESANDLQEPDDENPPASEQQETADTSQSTAEDQINGDQKDEDQIKYCPNGKNIQEDPECDDETTIYNEYSPYYYNDYGGYPGYSYVLPYYPQFYGNYPTYYGGYYNSWVYDYPWWNYPGYIYTSPRYYSFGGVYLPYFSQGNFRYWSIWGRPYWRHHDRWWRDHHHRVYDRDRRAVVDRGRDGWNMIRDGSIARDQRLHDGRSTQTIARDQRRTIRRDAGTIRSPTNRENRSLWQRPRQDSRTVPLYSSPRPQKNAGTYRGVFNRNVPRREINRQYNTNRLGNSMIRVPSRNIYQRGYNNRIYGNRSGLYSRSGVYTPRRMMSRDGSTILRPRYVTPNGRYQQPSYFGRNGSTFYSGRSFYTNRPTFRSSTPQTNFRTYSTRGYRGFGRSVPSIRHNSFGGGRSFGGMRAGGGRSFHGGRSGGGRGGRR